MKVFPPQGSEDSHLICMKHYCIVLQESNKAGFSGSAVSLSGCVCVVHI